MSKSLKLFLGISYITILFIFIYLVFSLVDLTKLDDFLYYKELQISLEKIISTNLYLNLLIFFLFSIIWVSLLGFGTPLLLVSGILFGKWVGTFISVLSISVGALTLYSIAQFFFKELIHNLFEKKFIKYFHLFKRREFNYFLLFRLCGGLGIPFGPQNILPVIFNIKKSNYFTASFIGFFPMFFIWNSIGSGLNEYVKQADDFSFINLLFDKEIYLPIIFFIVIMLVSIVVKKRSFGDKN
tara:strand:+ start:406 stop:1128 length:723 start_codon:yes stop_codon:yes gene_type:complete